MEVLEGEDDRWFNGAAHSEPKTKISIAPWAGVPCIPDTRPQTENLPPRQYTPSPVMRTPFTG